MMREIERQATEAWIATPCEVLGGPELAAMVGAPETRKAVAAHDFMVVRASSCKTKAMSKVGAQASMQGAIVRKSGERRLMGIIAMAAAVDEVCF
jgi:hypothetical protein